MKLVSLARFLESKMFNIEEFETSVRTLGMSFTIRLTAENEQKPGKYLVNVHNTVAEVYFPVFANDLCKAAKESLRRAELFHAKGVR
jgi:hypothetical protein